MEIRVDRFRYYDESTIGMMSIDGNFYCYTLEDVVRFSGPKVAGSTAIPTGRYEVVVNMSPRFKRELPLLVSVPGFTGVRIHRGNTATDTHGCLLVGRSWRKDFIGESKVMELALVKKLKECIGKKGSIWLDIRNNVESERGTTTQYA